MQNLQKRLFVLPIKGKISPDCPLSCQEIACNTHAPAFSIVSTNNTKNEDKLWIKPVASFFFRVGAIQGGDGLNENRCTSVSRKKLDFLGPYYELF